VEIEAVAPVEPASVDIAGTNADVSAEISAALEGFLADMPDDAPEAAPEPKAEAVAEVKTETKAEPVAETTEPPKPVETAPDRGAERLAAREAAVAEKEKALRDREKELGTLASRMRRGEFADALKSMGFEDREIPLVIRAAMASQLPADKVPDVYRQHAKELSTEERYRGMIQEALTKAQSAEDKLQQYQEAVAQQQYVAQYRAEAETYFNTSAETETPTFARLLKADRADAFRRFEAVVAADARAKVAAGGGAPMTPAEAAKAVEAELSRIASLLATATNSTPTTKTAVAGKPSPSLSTKTVPATSRAPSGQETVDISVERWLQNNGLS